METLKIITFLNELGEDQGGMSKPVIVLASDYHEYYLKNQYVYDEHNSKWYVQDCAFLQEYLANKIADFLEVPSPSPAIIDISKEDLENHPKLPFTKRFKAGKHYSTQQMDEVDNNLLIGYKKLFQAEKPYTIQKWNSFFKAINNPKDIARIICMDLLIANFDRFTNEGNLLVSSEEGVRKVYAIDHGHAFNGPIWNLHKQRLFNSINNSEEFCHEYINAYKNAGGVSGLGIIFKAIEHHIDVEDEANHDFKEVVLKAESIDQNLLDSWFRDIPEEWFVDKVTQWALYSKFILTNKKNLRRLIDLLVIHGAFTNTRGGALDWTNSRTGTQ